MIRARLQALVFEQPQSIQRFHFFLRARRFNVCNLDPSKFAVATGARPKNLPELKPDGKVVITSREAMVLPNPPKHLLVVGAGAIGIEFAYFYAVLGSKVTVVEFQESILPLNDREVAGLLAKSLQKRGIAIHTGSRLDNIAISDKGVTAKIVGAKDGKEVGAVEADAISVADAGHKNFTDAGNRRARMGGVVCGKRIGWRDDEVFVSIRRVIVSPGNIDAQEFSTDIAGVLGWTAGRGNAAIVGVAE